MEASLAALTGVHARLSAQSQALATWLRWASIALAATLPFELNGGLPLAGLTLTNVELLALLTLGLWSALLVSESRLPRVPHWLLFTVAALLATLILSALLADSWRGAALKFSARQVEGALIGWCVADQIKRDGLSFGRQLVAALIGGATVSAAVGLLEMAEWQPVLALLMAFKDQPTLAGGLLRLSATFAYANIAAMYFEAVMPLALLAVGVTVGWRSWLCAGAALLLYVATLLTYSRAALLTATLIVIATIAGAVALHRRFHDRRFRFLPVVGTGIALLVFLAGLALTSSSFQIRIAEPDVDSWYRAEYQIAPLPSLPPNGLTHVPVTVTNHGRVIWYSTSIRPVALSYHWLDAHTRLVVRYNGRRTPLPTPLAPGESITLNAVVQAPDEAGDYLLVWDMVVEQSGWFSERGNEVAEARVSVVGAPAVTQPAPAAESAGVPRHIVSRPPPPARLVLWRAAVDLWQERPALGIGPDVFRHVYGPTIGLRDWDDRIHTNNLYLEILVGAGVAGLSIFLVLLGMTSTLGLRELLSPVSGNRWALFGCLLGLGSYLIHGTLDMFLEYSATFLLAWALLGAFGALIAMKETS